MARGMGKVQRTIKALFSKEAAILESRLSKPLPASQDNRVWGLFGCFISFLSLAIGLLVPTLIVARIALFVAWISFVVAILLLSRDWNIKIRGCVVGLLSIGVGIGLLWLGRYQPQAEVLHENPGITLGLNCLPEQLPV